MNTNNILGKGSIYNPGNYKRIGIWNKHLVTLVLSFSLIVLSMFSFMSSPSKEFTMVGDIFEVTVYNNPLKIYFIIGVIIIAALIALLNFKNKNSDWGIMVAMLLVVFVNIQSIVLIDNFDGYNERTLAQEFNADKVDKENLFYGAEKYAYTFEVAKEGNKTVYSNTLPEELVESAIGLHEIKENLAKLSKTD